MTETTPKPIPLGEAISNITQPSPHGPRPPIWLPLDLVARLLGRPAERVHQDYREARIHATGRLGFFVETATVQEDFERRLEPPRGPGRPPHPPALPAWPWPLPADYGVPKYLGEPPPLPAAVWNSLPFLRQRRQPPPHGPGGWEHVHIASHVEAVLYAWSKTNWTLDRRLKTDTGTHFAPRWVQEVVTFYALTGERSKPPRLS